MFRHHLATTLALAALSIFAGACSPRDTNDRTASLGDSTAGAAKSAAGSRMATKTGEVRELQAPEAARWDFDQSVWFVANINGDPFGKDNNGFIARLTPEGKVDSLKFIAGGRGGVTLNAPKGMAITGDTLWVADIDAVRAFNKRTGAAAGSVRVPGAKFLNDITAGPDGTLYITDTGLGSKVHPPGPGPHLPDQEWEGDCGLRVQGARGAEWHRVHGGRPVDRSVHGNQSGLLEPGRKDGPAHRHGPGPAGRHRDPSRQPAPGDQLGRLQPLHRG